MIIYKCIISGDEMFSDIYKIKEVAGGIFYEVEGSSINRTHKIDESLLGANASAEEACEANEDSTETGVDIVINHKLVPTPFDKKSYVAYIKEYMKTIKARLPEQSADKVTAFEKSANLAVKDVIAKFKSFEFFTGESMCPEGMVGLLDYREDGVTPYMLFFKDGLEMEKC